MNGWLNSFSLFCFSHILIQCTTVSVNRPLNLRAHGYNPVWSYVYSYCIQHWWILWYKCKIIHVITVFRYYGLSVIIINSNLRKTTETLELFYIHQRKIEEPRDNIKGKRARKQTTAYLRALGKNKGPRVAFISSLLTGLKIQQNTIKANRWISEY